jgi:PAS domain S-box-containing protein
VSHSSELEAEVERLRVRLAEAEDTLRAIRAGEVDALVVEGPDAARIYTLKGADEPYRILVERMQEGAATLSAEGIVLYSNRGFAQMIGRSLEQVIGAPVVRFIEAAEQVALAAVLRAAKSGSIRREFALRRADGTVFPALLSLGPLPAEDGDDALSMIASDLSEQRRTEAIAMAERFLRSILEQAAEPIVVCDALGRITHASRAALALGAGDAIGRPVADALGLEIPDRTGQRRSARRRLAVQFARALRGRGVAGVEVRWTGPDGLRRDYLLSAGPLHDSRDVVVGCIAMLAEISERKRAEERQQVLLAELSHRVKNTLATVRSIATQTVRNAPSLAAFAPMFNGRLGALAVAHGVLTQAGWGEVELGELVERIVAPYQSGRHDHIKIAGVPARLPPRQVVPMTLMLHELATNAAKYGALSTPAGRVAVAWTVAGAGPARSVSLRWVESGGPRVRPPPGKGFGTALIERSMAYELDGEAHIDYRPEGLRCELTFPLTAPGQDLLQEAESSAERLRADFESGTVP